MFPSRSLPLLATLALVLSLLPSARGGPGSHDPGFLGVARDEGIRVSLRYEAASRAADRLKEILAEAARVEVEVDAKENALVLRGPARGIELLRTLVDEEDRPVPQVLVDARILRLPAELLTEVRRAGAGSYGEKLDELEAAGRCRTLASPRLLAVHGARAQLRIADEVTVSGGPSQPPETREVGTTMDLVPTIDADGRTVTLEVRVEHSRVEPPESGAPLITRNVMESEARVADGGEILIDGDETVVLLVPRILKQDLDLDR